MTCPLPPCSAMLSRALSVVGYGVEQRSYYSQTQMNFISRKRAFYALSLVTIEVRQRQADSVCAMATDCTYGFYLVRIRKWRWELCWFSIFATRLWIVCGDDWHAECAQALRNGLILSDGWFIPSTTTTMNTFCMGFASPSGQATQFGFEQKHNRICVHVIQRITWVNAIY